MPERRPPPVRLDLKAQARKRPAFKTRPPKRPGNRPRKGRSGGDDSTLPYWIAGGLIVLLAVIGGIYFETPLLQGWFANEPPTPPENLLPLPQKPAPARTQPSAEEVRLKREKEKAAEEKRLLAEREAEKPVVAPPPPAPLPKPVAKVPPPQPPPVIAPAPLSPETPPPLVQPVPIGAVRGAPARALPVDMH